MTPGFFSLNLFFNISPSLAQFMQCNIRFQKQQILFGRILFADFIQILFKYWIIRYTLLKKKITQNDPKIAKNDPKWAQNGPKMEGWPTLASLGEGANQFIRHLGNKTNCLLRPTRPTNTQEQIKQKNRGCLYEKFVQYNKEHIYIYTYLYISST